MSLSAIAAACIRRWYVVVVVLLLAALGAVRVYNSTQPNYTITSTVVVVPSPSFVAARLPTSPTGGVTTNPFNTQSGGAGVLAPLLADALNTATVQAQILGGARGGLVADWATETSQLVTLTAVSDSPQSAQATMDAAVTGAVGVVQGIQTGAGAPADQLFTAAVGAPADVPVEDFPGRLRNVVGTALLGVVGAVVLAVLWDGLAMRGAHHRQKTRDRGRTTAARGATPSAEVPVLKNVDGRR